MNLVEYVRREISLNVPRIAKESACDICVDGSMWVWMCAAAAAASSRGGKATGEKARQGAQGVEGEAEDAEDPELAAAVDQLAAELSKTAASGGAKASTTTTFGPAAVQQPQPGVQPAYAVQPVQADPKGF